MKKYQSHNPAYKRNTRNVTDENYNSIVLTKVQSTDPNVSFSKLSDKNESSKY